MDSPSESATGILTIIGNNPSSFTNYIIPLSSIGVKFVILDAFLIFMTIVFTSLRIISRRLRGQKLLPEDYLHIASMVRHKLSNIIKHYSSNCDRINRYVSKELVVSVLQVSQGKPRGDLPDLNLF